MVDRIYTEGEVNKVVDQTVIDVTKEIAGGRTRFKVAKYVLLIFSIVAILLIGVEGYQMLFAGRQEWSALVASIPPVISTAIGLIIGAYFESKKNEDISADQ